jgi:hypothetical protein
MRIAYSRILEQAREQRDLWVTRHGFSAKCVRAGACHGFPYIVLFHDESVLGVTVVFVPPSSFSRQQFRISDMNHDLGSMMDD